MQGWAELDVRSKSSVIELVVFVLVSAFGVYATVKAIKVNRLIEKRIGDDPADS